MELEFAGIMPDGAGPDIAGSTVYRVKNADEFFRKNTGKNAFCDRTPQWIAVNRSYRRAGRGPMKSGSGCSRWRTGPSSPTRSTASASVATTIRTSG